MKMHHGAAANMGSNIRRLGDNFGLEIQIWVLIVSDSRVDEASQEQCEM